MKDYRAHYFHSIYHLGKFPKEVLKAGSRYLLTAHQIRTTRQYEC